MLSSNRELVGILMSAMVRIFCCKLKLCCLNRTHFSTIGQLKRDSCNFCTVLERVDYNFVI